MKKICLFLPCVLVALTAPAQFGAPGHGSSGPQFNAAVKQLFGDNQTFTATLAFQTETSAPGNPVTMRGRMAFDAGKTRFEMNMADIQGSQMPPDAAAHMKAMGMDRMVAIGRPDKDVTYLIYPGLQSYLETPLPDSAGGTNGNFKIETTELGKETVDGHECIKNKVVITDTDGVKRESTVWNATDLKKFPVKIETDEHGHQAIMNFKDVSFTKPNASEFDAPAGYTKYDNMQAMMQNEMMKKMGGGLGMPGR